MELTWLDREHPDARSVAGAVAVCEAARMADRPHQPVQTVSMLLGRFRHGWDGQPPQVGVTQDADGQVVGVVELSLPWRDNTHLAIVYPVVDPAVRSPSFLQGLIDAAAGRARCEGRKLVLAVTPDSPEYGAVAAAMGFVRAYEEIERRQDVQVADWPRLDSEFAAAERQAEAYELIRIAAAVPDELLDAVTTLTASINDAPTEGLDVEDEVFTPDRIRAFEAASQGRNRRLYRLVARHRESGELAGHTIVGVENEQPWQAYQYDTSVLAGHRGHRLGLLLKIGMLRWLREAEPQVRFVDTDNAASNEHMIRVNELLGYRVIDQTVCWQKNLD